MVYATIGFFATYSPCGATIPKQVEIITSILVLHFFNLKILLDFPHLVSYICIFTQ